MSQVLKVCQYCSDRRVKEIIAASCAPARKGLPFALIWHGTVVHRQSMSSTNGCSSLFRNAMPAKRSSKSLQTAKLSPCSVDPWQQHWQVDKELQNQGKPPSSMPPQKDGYDLCLFPNHLVKTSRSSSGEDLETNPPAGGCLAS